MWHKQNENVIKKDMTTQKRADPQAADHIFIINPTSFRRKSDMDMMLAGINSELDRYPGLHSLVHVSRYPRDALGTVNRYLRDRSGHRPVRVYAVGGDGILFDCLNAVMEVDGAELAIVPYGRENNFLRAFGEGAEPGFRDIAALMAAPAIPTDVMLCDDKYALNFCLIGMETLSSLWKKGFRRRLTGLRNIVTSLNSVFYCISTLVGVSGERAVNRYYSLTADDEALDGVYTAIHIANGPCYGRSMTPTGESLPNDGLLELVTLNVRTKLAALATLPALTFGGHTAKKHFQHRLARNLRIASDNMLLINLDGEIFYETSINIRLLPARARIAAPGGAGYTQRKPHTGYSISTGGETV